MARAVIVVPTYNERNNLPTLLEKIGAFSPPIDVLIVDDSSPDGTGRLAEDLRSTRPWLHVLHRKNKEGLGKAYCAGFEWALAREYAFVLEMDADLSHNPDDAPRLLQEATHADLVIGSRYVNGIRVINWPLRRLLLSIGASYYVRTITGMPFADPTGGFKCFRRDALVHALKDPVHSNGYSFQIELTHRLWRDGWNIQEYPIVFTERTQGASKMSRRIIREAVIMVWRLLAQHGFTRAPRPKNPHATH